jgi:hypothetical protein
MATNEGWAVVLNDRTADDLDQQVQVYLFRTKKDAADWLRATSVDWSEQQHAHIHRSIVKVGRADSPEGEAPAA